MASHLWQRIRAIRKYMGLSQEGFGALFEVSKAAVSQWEAEDPEKRTAPPLPTQVEIARVSGAPREWVVFGDDGELGPDWYQDGDEPTADRPPRPVSRTAVALAQLAALLEPLDVDGRQSAATLLAAWARDPASKRTDAMLLEHLLGPRKDDAIVAQHIKPAPTEDAKNNPRPPKK